MNFRVFCRYLCPLGLMQSLVRVWRAPRRVCTRMPESKAQLAVRWTVFALYLVSFFVSTLYLVKPFVDPYSIVCRAVAYTFFSVEKDAALALLAYVPLGTVLAVSLASRGRGWCNWICPWGTLLNLLSRIRQKGDRPGRGCDRCKKCFKVKK